MRTTTRLRAALAVAVEDGRDQSEVAAAHGVSWPTVQRAVVARGAVELVEPEPVAVLGMDETRFGRPALAARRRACRRPDPVACARIRGRPGSSTSPVIRPCWGRSTAGPAPRCRPGSAAASQIIPLQRSQSPWHPDGPGAVAEVTEHLAGDGRDGEGQEVAAVTGVEPVHRQYQTQRRHLLHIVEVLSTGAVACGRCGGRPGRWPVISSWRSRSRRGGPTPPGMSVPRHCERRLRRHLERRQQMGPAVER